LSPRKATNHSGTMEVASPLASQTTNNTPALFQEAKYLKSWHSYVSDLASCDHISQAALYDCHGVQLATSSPEFGLSPEEYEKLVCGFRHPGSLERAGIWINGECYKVHLNDCHFGLMGKRDFPVPAGCSVCKTRKLLIVAVHKPGMRPHACNEAVMNMGDFFRRKDM
jgi:hypothetical protein